MKNNVRKVMRFIKSMKFGIVLMMIIIALSIIGTILPQNYEDIYYKTRYSPPIATLILGLKLNDMYSSLLFCSLFFLLAVNLLLCSITRLDRILHNIKKSASSEQLPILHITELDITGDDMMKRIFKSYGFNRYLKDKKQEGRFYSVKRPIGYFGSWLLHVGILVMIVSYAYGHSTYFSEAVYGIEGSVQTIEGTDYRARLKYFDIDFRQDGSVKQYTSGVELLSSQGTVLKTAPVSVNNPMRYKGYTFYQTGCGWAVNCLVQKAGKELKEVTLYEGTSMNMPDEDLVIYFEKFYPDFSFTEKGLATLSEQLNNPVSLYAILYKKEVVKMDIIPTGKYIRWNDYTFLLSNPQRYTYLDVNRMRGEAGAIIGVIFTILGLLLTFYYRPLRMMVQIEAHRISISGNVDNNVTMQEVIS